jgi:hypothetical protein
MLRVNLAEQRRNWAYRYMEAISSGKLPFCEGEEWRLNTNDENPSSRASCGVVTRKIDLPFPLGGINFEVNRVADRYGIATNVYTRMDDAFSNLSRDLVYALSTNFKLLLIPTSDHATGYILKKDEDRISFGAITEFRGLRELSIGLGGAQQLRWSTEQDFMIEIGRLMEYTNIFIEAVRRNYEKKTGTRVNFPNLNLIIP